MKAPIAHFNTIDSPTLDDYAKVVKAVLRNVNDAHHDIDFIDCPVVEMEQADGFFEDYINLLEANPQNEHTKDAISYVRTIQHSLRVAINKKEVSND